MNPLLAALCLVPVQDSKPAPKAPELKAAALKVQEDLADVAILQSLAPLKWTPEQLAQLLPALKKAQEVARDITRQDNEALVKLADDVQKARLASIGGATVPEALETRVNEMRRQAATRSVAATRKTVLELLGVLRGLLTDTQKAEIERQSEKFYGGKRVPKEYAKKPADAPKEVVQDLAISAYIENVLLFDRAIPLLEAMKAALAKTP